MGETDPDSAASGRPTSPVVTLTPAAAAHLSALYAKGGQKRLLRIGVDARGCSGLAYRMSWAEAAGPDDETVHDRGVTLLVEHQASPFLAGSVVDYDDRGLSSGFRFLNPNEKDRCGCGSSFRV